MVKPYTFENAYSVTMFSFTNELLQAQHSPAELAGTLLASGVTKNLEFDGPQFFRNFGQVGAELTSDTAAVDQLRAKYGSGISLLGGYVDRAIGPGQLQSSDAVLASVTEQLKLANRIGARGMRMMVDALTLDELRALAPIARDQDVRILFELQGSMTPEAETTRKCLDTVAALDTEYVGVMFDSSLFMRCFPPSFKALLTRLGVTTAMLAQLEKDWLTLNPGQLRGKLVAAIDSGDLPGSLHAVLPTIVGRMGHGSPADWAAVAPQIQSVQLKYWDNDDTAAAVSGPTLELMQLLAGVGYSGHYCSEWGGHEWHSLTQQSSLDSVRAHRALVEACFHQAH